MSIEEVLDNEEYVDPEIGIMLRESLVDLEPVQILVLLYWFLGFTQEETRFMIFPGRSRAYIWQVKNRTMNDLRELLDGGIWLSSMSGGS